MASPAPADIAYMKEHRKDSLVPQILAINILCMAIAFTAIWLRIISRHMIRAPLKMDDWTIIAAMAGLSLTTKTTVDTNEIFLQFLFTIFGTCSCLTTLYGGGRYVILVTDMKALAQLCLVAECIYPLAISAIKTSILYLYHRIFPQRWFHIALQAVGAFVVLWAISTSMISIFRCTPLKARWETTASVHCIDFTLISLVVSILSVVTDFVILALPMYSVWHLQTSTKNKWMLTAIFTIGCCACIVSIVRLVYIASVAHLPYTTKANIAYDQSWTLNKAVDFSAIELMAGIFAACVPTYRPLFKYWTDQLRTRGAKRTFLPASSPHVMGMSGSRSYRGDQPNSIQMMDKAASRLDSGHSVRHWIRISDVKERLVRGVQ